MSALLSWMAYTDQEYINEQIDKYDLVTQPYLPSEMIAAVAKGNAMAAIFGGKKMGKESVYQKSKLSVRIKIFNGRQRMYK